MKNSNRKTVSRLSPNVMRALVPAVRTALEKGSFCTLVCYNAPVYAKVH
jgi:hypothetical protein